MTKPMSRRQLEVIAAHLCELANEIAHHRQGGGPHWTMLAHVEREMLRVGIEIHRDDLRAAVLIAVERCVLKTEGEPIHSISAWPRNWHIGEAEARQAGR